jgi:acyl-CoA synthetase (AMP-forming)/AMP-acid ligase II
MEPKIALVQGSTEPALWFETLGSFIDKQAAQYEDRVAAVFPWQSVQLSYRQLADRSKILAKAMLETGLRKGDCIGIMAGNCYQYIEVFLGGGGIGCPVVVLNNTYIPGELMGELMSAVQKSCKF